MVTMQPLGEHTINVPAFLGKLWKMVNDPETDHLICWNTAGNSFVIQNQAQFWYELLPVYYKHNNMSSFVRQLNMYGFHKVSSVENGTMDADKDEIIFFHPYFQKDQVELLRMIKRKVTAPKPESHTQSNVKSDDITKVLLDVKQIKGRQASVDNQLSAMKQENAVLWRELALLRQKHMKQQQIVNKLIQFLITLVQPSRIGVGAKRKFPLMLCEKPTKKAKQKPKKPHKPHNRSHPEGPTIHELDNELELVKEELEEQMQYSPPLINSPENSTGRSSNPPSPISFLASGSNEMQQSENPIEAPATTEDILEDTATDLLPWDPQNCTVNPEYVIVEDDGTITPLQNLPTYTNQNVAPPPDVQKVFLNPNTQDTLLTNLINGNYNINALNFNKNASAKKSPVKNVQRATPEKVVSNEKSLQVLPTKDPQPAPQISTVDDLHTLVGSTQNDLEQLKDILATCGGFDANALLGLFNDESPDYGLGLSTEKESDLGSMSTDPMVSGSQLAPYGINIMDFNELFDDSADNNLTASTKEANLDSTINTPQVESSELTFPPS